MAVNSAVMSLQPNWAPIGRLTGQCAHPDKGDHNCGFRAYRRPSGQNTVFQLKVLIAADPPAISKHVEEERVILTESEHEAMASAYVDSSTE